MQTSAWSSGLFGTDNQNMRVSDAERQAVADRLAAHYADGRLDQAEFDERCGRAMNAKTRADLGGLFDDLPEAPGTLGTGPSGAPGIPPQSGVVGSHRHYHPLLKVLLVVVIISCIAHAVFWALGWLWIGVLAVIVLAATGHLGHHHHHHPGHHHGPQRVEDDI
jgi:hypothetical protein